MSTTLTEEQQKTLDKLGMTEDDVDNLLKEAMKSLGYTRFIDYDGVEKDL